MNDDEFEWDDAKAAANDAKHGIEFEMARDAFDDPFGITWDDDSEDYGEERHCLLGMVNSRLLFVSYTLRGDRTRIISARGAKPYEHRRYHEENSQ